MDKTNVKWHFGHIHTFMCGTEIVLCVCNDRLLMQRRFFIALAWEILSCICCLSFLTQSKHSIFLYNVLFVTINVFIPTFSVGSWTLWQPHLFRSPLLHFPCKAIMPSTVKVPLICLAHVLCPQFELGQHGASCIRHSYQGRGFNDNFVGYLSLTYLF